MHGRKRMITEIKNSQFNREINIHSGWQYAAAAVGLKRFFESVRWDQPVYEELEDGDGIRYSSLIFEREDFDQLFGKFIESEFSSRLHHLKMLNLVNQAEDLSEEQLKLLKSLMEKTSLLKRLFKGVYSTNENKLLIKEIIESEKTNLTFETFRHGKSMYANYCNTNRFGSDSKKTSRLLGYSVDEGRKTKSISFGWKFNAQEFNDHREFDFIPFAFTKNVGNQTFFINSNLNFAKCYSTNNELQVLLNEKTDSGKTKMKLLDAWREISGERNIDVEVIAKVYDVDYFQTIYIRKNALDIFKSIAGLSSILPFYFLKGKDPTDSASYIYLQDEVVDHILNFRKLDNIVNLLLKEYNGNLQYTIYQLIKINDKIYGGIKMNKLTNNEEKLAGFKPNNSAEIGVSKVSLNRIRGCGSAVVNYFDRNSATHRLRSYIQKLLSAIIFQDQKRFFDVLLNLSQYTKISFFFVYALLEDFEGNKNVAYAFVNSLMNVYPQTAKDEKSINENSNA